MLVTMSVVMTLTMISMRRRRPERRRKGGGGGGGDYL